VNKTSVESENLKLELSLARAAIWVTDDQFAQIERAAFCGERSPEELAPAHDANGSTRMLRTDGGQFTKRSHVCVTL
jgi:hypothetical protein